MNFKEFLRMKKKYQNDHQCKPLLLLGFREIKKNFSKNEKKVLTFKFLYHLD